MTLVLTWFVFGDNFSYNVIKYIILPSIDLAVICISVPREKKYEKSICLGIERKKLWHFPLKVTWKQ